MEKIYSRKGKQRKIESIVLIIYCVYNIGISVNLTNNDWGDWVIFIVNAGWLLSLLVYVGKYRSYRFRAFFTALMLQVGMIFYAMQVPNLFPELVNIIAITVFLGVYGIPDIIAMTSGSVTFLICYHLLVLEEFYTMDARDLSRMLQWVTSVYLAQFIMYYLVKQQLKAREEQQAIIEKLEAAEESKDDFLANVSHEIRTPINTICGMCEVVLQEKLPKSVREDIFSIQTAGKNLLSVVSDVLDFSELQSGKIELAEVNYNITSTVNDVICMTMARKCEKQIELIVDCSADFPCGLYGDEQKIRRVIINLVNNAIKFTDEGCVSIRFSYRKTDYGINLMIKVKDTGIGMKEESIEKLFTRYNQVDTKRNRQEGGIGLGIAISQAIVEKMGGFITVKSELGKGSEMTVVIPQTVVDENPIVSIKEPERINVAVYINMEQFRNVEVRDEYTSSIRSMIHQLDVKCQLCHRFAELKRKVEREIFTHVFISVWEYEEDKAYFDALAFQVKVVVILDRGDEKKVQNPDILRIYKPFFVLPIVSLINNGQSEQEREDKHYFYGGFIAPEVHILVVDDNVMNLRVIEGLLQPYQIKVSTATSGREALEKIETKAYDFVFMDHMMPEMDGIETLHYIRKKNGKYFKSVPVIALTANAIAGMREEFLREGFQDFIAKPIELSVLERVLKRNIPEQKIIRLNGSVRKIEKEEHLPKEETTLKIGDLDVQKGLTYCGGLENYIEVLKIHCRDGVNNKEKIDQCYREKDWKNYVILVHALKSSMLSIGAVPLSEMARELERAGKAGHEAFILEHHEAMLTEYERVLSMLQKEERINTPVMDEKEKEVSVEAASVQKADEQTEGGEEELSEAEFDKMLEEMEEAAYALNEEAMLVILEKMQQYRYHGYPLKEELEPVKKKIDMSDFISATEAVKKLKAKEKGVR